MDKMTTEEVNLALEDLIHSGVVSPGQLGRKAYCVLLKLNKWLLRKSDVNLSIESDTSQSESTQDNTSQHKF